jgi:hypothetical protein
MVAAFVAVPGVASAYVRQTTPHGTPLSWQGSSCVFVTPDAKGLSTVPFNQVLGEIQAATEAWMGGTQGCSYITFKVDQPDGGRVAGRDGINLVTFLEDQWGRESNGSFIEYSPSAQALTTLFYVNNPSLPQDGQILDADTEVDAKYYTFGILDGRNPPQCDQNTNGCLPGTPCEADIRNTLVHEFGHMLGLDHTCYDMAPRSDGTIPPRPLDNNGQPVPLCGSPDLAPSVLNSVMYNFAECNEVSKRMPAPDDVNAICAIYPLAQGVPACKRAPIVITKGGCACSVASAPDAPSARGCGCLLAVAGATLAGLRPRMRARSRRSH